MSLLYIKQYGYEQTIITSLHLPRRFELKVLLISLKVLS